MKNYCYPIGDGLAKTIETHSENAYVFCAPETID